MNAELTVKIRELMKELNIPGAAIGIYNAGDVTTQGFGKTNLDHPLPVDDDTLFQIGSITKTFVGTMTMMLVLVVLLHMERTAHVRRTEESGRPAWVRID